MKTSDDKRREVAENLRHLDDETCALIDERMYRLTNEEMAGSAVLNIGLCIAMYEAGFETKTLGDFWDLLADLIDVPTTVLDLTETTRTVHGEEVHVWECRECAQSCEEMYGGYEYCPHCGRKVVRTND